MGEGVGDMTYEVYMSISCMHAMHHLNVHVCAGNYMYMMHGGRAIGL